MLSLDNAEQVWWSSHLRLLFSWCSKSGLLSCEPKVRPVPFLLPFRQHGKQVNTESFSRFCGLKSYREAGVSVLPWVIDTHICFFLDSFGRDIQSCRSVSDFAELLPR